MMRGRPKSQKERKPRNVHETKKNQKSPKKKVCHRRSRNQNELALSIEFVRFCFCVVVNALLFRCAEKGFW